MFFTPNTYSEYLLPSKKLIIAENCDHKIDPRYQKLIDRYLPLTANCLKT
jgi:hypothetical protein